MLGQKFAVKHFYRGTIWTVYPIFAMCCRSSSMPAQEWVIMSRAVHGAKPNLMTDIAVPVGMELKDCSGPSGLIQLQIYFWLLETVPCYQNLSMKLIHSILSCSIPLISIFLWLKNHPIYVYKQLNTLFWHPVSSWACFFPVSVFLYSTS